MASEFSTDSGMTRGYRLHNPRPQATGEALALRARYGDRVVEIIDRTEDEVAESLKEAKVFV